MENKVEFLLHTNFSHIFVSLPFYRHIHSLSVSCASKWVGAFGQAFVVVCGVLCLYTSFRMALVQPLDKYPRLHKGFQERIKRLVGWAERDANYSRGKERQSQEENQGTVDGCTRYYDIRDIYVCLVREGIGGGSSISKQASNCLMKVKEFEVRGIRVLSRGTWKRHG